MKKFLLAVIFVFGFVISFSNTDITLPNKDIKVVKDVLLYKNSPFTGNIIMSAEDKKDGYSGAISLKNGHLDGVSELRNDRQGELVKFTVTDGKFDGELIMNDPSQGVSIKKKKKKGAIVQYFADIQGIYEYDLSFVNNLANGTMKADGQEFRFKNGIAKGPQGQELKLSLDPVTGDMEMEAYVNGRVAGKETIPNILTPQYLETFLFQAVTDTNY